MIIGCKVVDIPSLKRACVSVDRLVTYATELVPTPLQHLTQIVDNQKYFVALQVRQLQSLPWRKRKELCEGLLSGIRIKGMPDGFYDYTDILLAIDKEAFVRYLREDRNAER